MYQKMTSYGNDNRYDYPYQMSSLVRKKEDWTSLESSNNFSQSNYMVNFASAAVDHRSSYPVQNEIKRFKLNNYGNYIQETEYFQNDVQHHYESSKSFIQCDTKSSSSIAKKQINSPTSSLSSSSESTSSEHASIYDSLHKAYQTGQITKTRYRRLIANERERNRMHGLNVAFENLRAVLPSLGSSKQFSK